MDENDKNTIKELVRKHGLRPVVDAVGYATRQLFEAGEPIKDEDGEPMFADDVKCAIDNLVCGDLY
jgi:hypothetical protein